MYAAGRSGLCFDACRRRVGGWEGRRNIAFAARHDEPDGCIIACFGEPGLLEARQRFDFPIIGMAEASMLTAMQLGGNFAILTLGEHWPAMLRDLVKLYGVQDRCIGIERIDGTPFELMADPRRRRNP